MVTTERVPDFGIEARSDIRIKDDAPLRSTDGTNDNVITPLADTLVSTADEAAPRQLDVKTATALQVPEDISLIKRQAALGESYAKSIGFSPAVARRVAPLRRPDVLKTHETPAAADPSARSTCVCHRGLNDVFLAEFRPRFNAPSYFLGGTAGRDPKNTWAMQAVVSGKYGVLTPSAGQLVRGFLLELEIPAHLMTHMNNIESTRHTAKLCPRRTRICGNHRPACCARLEPIHWQSRLHRSRRIAAISCVRTLICARWATDRARQVARLTNDGSVSTSLEHQDNYAGCKSCSASCAVSRTASTPSSKSSS